MWMTPDGVTHTNAHASPAQVVTDRMWASLVSIGQQEGEAAAEVIFGGYAAVLDSLEDLDLSELDPDLEGQWIPDDYLDGDFSTSAEVRDYLGSLPIAWRMDAFEVVTDILDELTARSRWQRLRGFLRRGRRGRG